MNYSEYYRKNNFVGTILVVSSLIFMYNTHHRPWLSKLFLPRDIEKVDERSGIDQLSFIRTFLRRAGVKNSTLIGMNVFTSNQIDSPIVTGSSSASWVVFPRSWLFAGEFARQHSNNSFSVMPSPLPRPISRQEQRSFLENGELRFTLQDLELLFSEIGASFYLNQEERMIQSLVKTGIGAFLCTQLLLFLKDKFNRFGFFTGRFSSYLAHRWSFFPFLALSIQYFRLLRDFDQENQRYLFSFLGYDKIAVAIALTQLQMEYNSRFKRHSSFLSRLYISSSGNDYSHPPLLSTRLSFLSNLKNQL